MRCLVVLWPFEVSQSDENDQLVLLHLKPMF